MKYINRIIAVLIIAVLSFLPCDVFGQNERYEVPLGNSVFMGPADAPITIFEFLDFQ
jgi:hypothetical protein